MAHPTRQLQSITVVITQEQNNFPNNKKGVRKNDRVPHFTLLRTSGTLPDEYKNGIELAQKAVVFFFVLFCLRRKKNISFVPLKKEEKNNRGITRPTLICQSHTHTHKRAYVSLLAECGNKIFNLKKFTHPGYSCFDHFVFP